MKPINITDNKGNFFKVLGSTPHSQIAVMTLEPGGDSGPEDIHDGDQIVYVIEGTATIEIEHEKQHTPAGSVATIPARSQHHIYNESTEALFILNVYAPPAY